MSCGAELGPAALTSLIASCAAFSASSPALATAAVWDAGRESTVQVWEITIPGDFTSTEQGRRHKAFELCRCFEHPSEFGLMLQGCCCYCLLCPQDAPLAFGGVVAPTTGHHAGAWPGSPWEHKSHFAYVLCPSSMFLPPLLHSSALHSQGEDGLLP